MARLQSPTLCVPLGSLVYISRSQKQWDREVQPFRVRRWSFIRRNIDRKDDATATVTWPFLAVTLKPESSDDRGFWSSVVLVAPIKSVTFTKSSCNMPLVRVQLLLSEHHRSKLRDCMLREFRVVFETYRSVSEPY